MLDPSEAQFLCEDNKSVLSTYNDFVGKLPYEVLGCLSDVVSNYTRAYEDAEARRRLHGRTVAQILSEYECPPGWEFDPPGTRAKRREQWSHIRRVVKTGTPDELSQLACPRCGGPLEIRFESDKPKSDGSTAGDLFINCLMHAEGSVTSGLKSPPPWVDSVGPRFTTRPS
jgi:hypothetical protein